MKNNWKTVFVGILVMLAIYIASGQFGLHEIHAALPGLLLYFIGGVLLAVVWIIVSVSKMQTQSTVLFVLAAGGFALLGSFIWELTNLLLNTTSTEVARDYLLQQYALSNMLAGLCGGLFWAYISYKSLN